MTATYTWDIFSSLDGFGSNHGDWGGYWGKQGPELLQHRFELMTQPQGMVFGANTYRLFVEMLKPGEEQPDALDPWVQQMRSIPAVIISHTLNDPLDWPDATVAAGDGIETVRRLKQDADIPLRSHGSLALNRALMAAGLVDRLQVTIYPVITGQTGDGPLFAGAADFDLELLEQRTLDGHTQELTYRPHLHKPVS